MIPALNLPPAALPPARETVECRLWLDRIAQCAVSCGKTIEARKIRANEAPFVLGSLCVALADHIEMPLEAVLKMVGAAAHGLTIATPENLDAIPS